MYITPRYSSWLRLNSTIFLWLAVVKSDRENTYKPEYATQAQKLCFISATDDDMVDFFDVEVSTINNWKTNFLNLESVKKEKMLADANVADRLYQRAMGYEASDVDIRKVGGEIIQNPWWQNTTRPIPLPRFFAEEPPTWEMERQIGNSDVKPSDGSMTPAVRLTLKNIVIAEDVFAKI